MKFSMNEETRASLIESLNKKEKDAVRIFVKGYGWSGPSFGVALDKQNDDDDVFEADGFKIVAEKEISFLFENSFIRANKGMFGDFYTVSINGESEDSGCSCS